MATVNIGNLTFTHKGDYASGTTYAKNDVVYYSTNGNAYIAKQATQGNAPTSTAHWNVFTQGSGGIWNAGLSLGSASQKLRVNSGGNALEFFTEPTVTSDVVKLASVATNTTHTTIDINGYFDDSVYGSYKLVMHSIKPENNSGNLTAKWMTSSSATHDSANYLVFHTAYQSSSGSSNGVQNRAYWNTNAFNDLEGTWTPKATATTDYQYCSMEATIINPQSTSQGKVMLYKFGTFSTTQGVMIVSDGQMFTNSNTAMTGFRLYRSSNSFLQSAWELYGFKK